jgi:hypothetical protein
VNDSSSFNPPKRTGIIFHIVSIFVLIVGAAVGLYRIAYADIGPTFFLYLLPIILAVPLVPLLIYRLSYLQNAVYILARECIRLQWGLRVEVIPTNTILWIQRASDLSEPVRYPWFRWPGSVLGTRKLGGETPVEFLASTSNELILVATYERVYAISPQEPEEFLNAYQRLNELGSLISPHPQSVHPTSLFAGVWKNTVSRYLIILGIILSIILIVWIVLVAPTRPVISLGFTPTGEPREPIRGVRLLLLPILNSICLVLNFFAGLLLFRRVEQRLLSYLLWGNTVVVAGLFLMATYFILRTG